MKRTVTFIPILQRFINSSRKMILQNCIFKKQLPIHAKMKIFFSYQQPEHTADIYIATKRANLAEAPLNEALSIRKQIGDPYYIVSDISQLAIYYANISQPEKGIKASLEGIELCKKI
jgi:hypothetical protein